ncbi:unnamed protein product [Aureobasidium pullulans]|nr:unnamed protein product [Aureobasidium pullulans]
MQLYAIKAWPAAAEYHPVYISHGTSVTTLPTQNPTWTSPTAPSLTGSSVQGGSSNGPGNTYGSTPAMSPNQQQLYPTSFHSSPSSELVDEDELVNLFYSNFFSAHPILYLATPLRASIDLTGHESTEQKDSSMVQARLLFAIALHARGEAMEAANMMHAAVSLAIEIGMNLRNFATAHGQGNLVQEESLRRTWWELYVMDGYMAALHKRPSFKSNTVHSGVLLPCEEVIYASLGCLPQPPSLEQFDMRLFADEEIQFSSFAYRIEAARILARVLSVAGTQYEDQVQVVDNALAGWIHGLPQIKADVVNSYNVVDEMLFQGHMIIQCATIYLHLPRSDLLNTLPVTANIVCAERGRHMSPASTQHMHSVKATNARNWAISGQVLVQVKKVASEVLQTSNLSSPSANRQDNTAYDSGISIGNSPSNTSWLSMLNMVENQEFHGLMHLESIYPGSV